MAGRGCGARGCAVPSRCAAFAAGGFHDGEGLGKMVLGGVCLVECCHASVHVGVRDGSRIHLVKAERGVSARLRPTYMLHIPGKRAAAVQPGCPRQDTIFFSSLPDS